MERWIAIPDVHFPFADHKALSAVVHFAKAYEPERIFVLGDLLDAYALSSHTKQRDSSLREEIRQARSFLTLLRAQHPDARIYLCEGNHEQRLTRYLANRASALLDVDGIGWPDWLGLDALEIAWTPYMSEFEPWPGFLVEHGDRVRKWGGYSAHAHLERAGSCSGISGHTHRLAYVARTTRSGTHSWLECGHLAAPEVSKEYVRHPDWQQGFACGTYTEEEGALGWPIRIVNGRVQYPPPIGRL